MRGTIKFISVFDPRVSIEPGMLVFAVANDPIWEMMIKHHDYHTVEINSTNYVVGPIHDMDQLVENDLNDGTMIFVVEYSDGFLPLCYSDCLDMITRPQIDKVVEFQPMRNEFGIKDVAVITELL